MIASGTRSHNEPAKTKEHPLTTTVRTQCALVAGTTVNVAMFTTVCALLLEAHLAESLMLSIAITVGILTIAVLWIRRRRPTSLEPNVEARTTTRTLLWIISRLGIIVVGLSESFLPGVLFLVLGDYFSAHGYLLGARFLDTGYVLCLAFLATLFFVLFNALLKQWLLAAANVLGPLLAFALVAAAASAIGSIG